MIEQYLEVLDLKDVKRTGWQIYNVEGPESVAGHSWSVALLTMIHLPEALDMEKALKTAIVHDVGEAKIGDVPYRAKGGYDVEGKDASESDAVEEIASQLDTELIELYRDYASRRSREAKFVKDMDLIDMVLQALKYERNNRYNGNPETDYDDLDEFFETSRSRFNTEKGLELFGKVEEIYLGMKR